jgi:hypothetical protein
MAARSRIGGSLVLAVALAAGGAGAGPAQADTFEVNRLGDPAPSGCTRSHCTLREAILRANNNSPGRDTIVLPNRRRRYEIGIPNADTAGDDGSLTGDLDSTNEPLKIIHRGRGLATVDGNGLDRVFEAFATLTLKRIKVTGGNSVANDEDDGGGIKANAMLKLVRSRVVRNTGDDGAGIAGTAAGRVRIVRSRIAGNDDHDGGAGLYLENALPSVVTRSRIVGNTAVGPADEAGGINVLNANLTISKSTIASNTATREGGGIRIFEGRVRIKDSTISGNRAIQSPTFDPADGGGIHVNAGQLTLVNSTVHGNAADAAGGGIFAEGGSTVSLNAVTLARNASAADDVGKPVINGGGFYHGSPGTFTVRNSIIALNTVGASRTTRNDCAFALSRPTSLGHNLLSTTGPNEVCLGFDEPGDKIRSNPKIGALKRNGGPTKTVGLKRGSAAIGNAHKPSAPNRDQRGRRRGNDPDIGAFERGA